MSEKPERSLVMKTVIVTATVLGVLFVVGVVIPFVVLFIVAVMGG